MRIGFDAKRAFLNSSGLGNYSRNTLKSLRQFFPENDYVLFTPEIKEELFADYHHFKVVAPQNIVVRQLKSLWRSFLLVTLAKRYEVDIYHGLSNELPKGIRKSGIPSVVTIHDVVFMRYPEFYKPVDRKIYFKKVKHACKSATKIIVISKQTRKDLHTFFKVPGEKTELIYQPVSPVFFERQNTKRALHNYQLPEKFILAVGTLEPRKNQLVLLQALKAANIDLPLVLVGKPTSYISKLRRFLSENGMDNQVIFLNGLPEKDLAALYQSAELSVYISVFEGFGLPVIESMASGCPVVTSNVSVLPETAGEGAILCDPANAEDIGEKIKLLLEDADLKNRTIQKGYQRAKLFHPETYAEKVITLYSKIMEEKNAKRY